MPALGGVWSLPGEALGMSNGYGVVWGKNVVRTVLYDNSLDGRLKVRLIQV